MISNIPKTTPWCWYELHEIASATKYHELSKDATREPIEQPWQSITKDKWVSSNPKHQLNQEKYHLQEKKEGVHPQSIMNSMGSMLQIISCDENQKSYPHAIWGLTTSSNMGTCALSKRVHENLINLWLYLSRKLIKKQEVAKPCGSMDTYQRL